MVGERVGDSIYKHHVTPVNCVQRESFAVVAVWVSISSITVAPAKIWIRLLQRVTQNDEVGGCERCGNLSRLSLTLLNPSMEKMHPLPFPSEGRGRAENVDDILHGDVGMVRFCTYDGCNYYSLLKDEASGIECEDKNKSEASVRAIKFCEKNQNTNRPTSESLTNGPRKRI